MDIKQKVSITNMDQLQREKLRLQVLAKEQEQVLKSDIDYLKAKFAPLTLANKGAEKVVPETVRHSPIINDPINFIAKRLFHKEENVVSTHSDQGKGNVIRNIALSIGEGFAAYLVTRFIKRRIF
jgi:hypothetical protein